MKSKKSECKYKISCVKSKHVKIHEIATFIVINTACINQQLAILNLLFIKPKYTLECFQPYSDNICDRRRVYK